MKVIYDRKALNALDRIPAQDRAALRRKLAAYAESGMGDVIKLADQDRWRLRHGVWRAVFVIKNDVVVIEIAHRREIHR